MEDNNIIDYGTWTVPTDWKDLTLLQYQELTKYYANTEKDFDAREVLHILSNKTIDEVNALPIQFTESLLSKMEFLTKEPKIGEPSTVLMINGERYSINTMEKMKTGEYLAIDTVLKNDHHNFATILAVLCRKDGEIYDSQFENEKVEERIKMFEGIPMLEAMKVINFFLMRYTLLELPTQLSSQIREGINHMRQGIENSHKNGEVSKRTMKSVMKTLSKLERTISGI